MSDVAIDQPISASARQIGDILADLDYSADFIWAFDNYKATIIRLAQERNLTRHLEIGGGRDPLFLPNDLQRLGFDVTLNDISAHELALAPNGYKKIVCDIIADSGPAILGEECYDLAYCRMVMEHVPDVAKMWRNIHAALAPGGVMLSFFPTLYAPPYVLNRMIPEKWSRFILETIFPDRKEDGDNPKFPAFYDHCFSDERHIKPMLESAGFSDIVIVPFWGYSYFWKFPGLKQIDAAFTRLARKRNWRFVSSFAYVIATK
ncbi:MAG: class I SAM-dependent methyltransferase [Methylovirgula sp.]